MREVWEWHAQTVQANSWRFCYDIHSCCQLPLFPGNLSAAERKGYFAKVHKHASALIELLGRSSYGSNCASTTGFTTEEVDNDKLAEIVVKDLASWGDDETGHVVAYYVDEDGVSRLPWSYPESSLCDLLYDVIHWTEDDDFFDLMRSSKPLESVKGASRNVIYFTRTLYGKLAWRGIKIPFARLATVTNVALALSSTTQVDEDTVRKQVRRYKQDYVERDRTF